MHRARPRLTPAAAAFAALAVLCAGAQAAQPAGKPNGDGPDDLAPLGRAGDNNTAGPVATQNTPPIGGATQAGGGNPKESGATDPQRAKSSSSSGDTMQPDHR